MSKQKSPLQESLLSNYTNKNQQAKKPRLKFLLKVFHTNATVEKYRTASFRRFLNYVRTIIQQNFPFKTYLKVSYGKQECNLGCVCNFYNDGYYTTPTDLWQAFCSFVEDYHRRPTK